MKYANGNLAAHKKICFLKIVEAMPVSVVEKVLGRELREQAQDLVLN
jgi:hypothetical protein